ncbi:MAG: pyridoxamine 5'-phosphate oxidase, partial [Ignavibacteriaceae bacterium]|nr:pyridoxamine 5'-phosphate oxidase [Ignavibacteriaceae bacterium]
FQKWFNELLNLDLIEPNAMILATADNNAKASARVVLLKGLSNKGFSFFTNYKSRKGQNLSENSFASLLFFWAELERQVRIEGKIKKLSRFESRKYFDTRPLESRIAAWASEQSKIIPDRKYLEEKFKETKEKFEGKKIPLPPNWGGFILIPEYFEFWQGRENRLHDRICYKKTKQSWKIFRLAP